MTHPHPQLGFFDLLLRKAHSFSNMELVYIFDVAHHLGMRYHRISPGLLWQVHSDKDQLQ